jgi:hypothetical protein
MKKMSMMIKATAAAAMLASLGLAHGAMLDFEGMTGNASAPFFQYGETSTFGNYWVTSYAVGSVAGDSAGMLIDGANMADICSNGVKCPAGNTSNFYGALNDGYIVFGHNDNSSFKLKSFDASIIGIEGQTYRAEPNPSALLILRGFKADNSFLDSSQMLVTAPASGNFTFQNYSLNAAFAATDFVAVRVLSYAWNGTTYTNGGSLSNVALDNFLEVSAVPEPSSWALMGLGLAAFAAFSRRKAA